MSLIEEIIKRSEFAVLSAEDSMKSEMLAKDPALTDSLYFKVAGLRS